MGRDIHLFLEIRDEDDFAWDTVAQVYSRRYIDVFAALIKKSDELRNFPVLENNRFDVRVIGLHTWVAWKKDVLRLGIHHEAVLDFEAFRYMAFPYPELRIILGIMQELEIAGRKPRLLYWFDN